MNLEANQPTPPKDLPRHKEEVRPGVWYVWEYDHQRKTKTLIEIVYEHTKGTSPCNKK